MATGRMTYNREKVWRHGLKVLPIKDNIKKDRSMDMDTMFGLTAQTIRESGVRTKSTDWVLTFGKMVASTSANGSITTCMGMAFTFMRME